MATLLPAGLCASHSGFWGLGFNKGLGLRTLGFKARGGCWALTWEGYVSARHSTCTLPSTNMEAQKGPCKDYSPFKGGLYGFPMLVWGNVFVGIGFCI